jgi:hypothetical protein
MQYRENYEIKKIVDKGNNRNYYWYTTDWKILDLYSPCPLDKKNIFGLEFLVYVHKQIPWVKFTKDCKFISCKKHNDR